MKQNFGIWMLLAALMLTLCACGSVPGAESSSPAAPEVQSENDGQIIVSETVEEESAYEDMGIALGPAFQRRGYGRQILEAFCEEARRCGAGEFRTSYRLANLSSQRLQEACGFVFDFDSEERTDPRTGETYMVRSMKKVL